MSANDKNWQLLFEKYNIVEQVYQNGYFDITATQIKEFREPRLMCKMDFKQSVAKPFKENELSILAIKNGIYRIAQTSPFFEIDLEKVQKLSIKTFQLPIYIQTLDFENITSESQALDAAAASGMLKSLLNEDSFLTVRGRRYTSEIEIKIKKNGSNDLQSYPVVSVQIEVDGGYESPNKLALIEAKMGSADNMNMRQLLYPHIYFSNQISKEVNTYLMFYETGSLFTFIPMNILNDKPMLDYGSAVRYKLVNSNKSLHQQIHNEIKLKAPTKDAPFPQADDFEKVLFGYFKVATNEGTEEEIFSDLAIVPRQYNYYFNALKWLGLANKEGRGKPIHLTNLGEQLLDLNELDRLQVIWDIISLNPVVEHIQRTPSAPLPEALKKEYGLEGKSMYPRRKSTILAWLKFIEEKLT